MSWTGLDDGDQPRSRAPYGAPLTAQGKISRAETQKRVSRRGLLGANPLLVTFAEVAATLPKNAVTSIDGLPYPRIASGKVREIFDLGDALLLVATDRLSALDRKSVV